MYTIEQFIELVREHGEAHAELAIAHEWGTSEKILRMQKECKDIYARLVEAYVEVISKMPEC